jgi:hypothetical protein
MLASKKNNVAFLGVGYVALLMKKSTIKNSHT